MPDWRDEVCAALDFWIAAEGGRNHPGGYIINSERNPRPSYLVLHRATCGHLTSPNPLRWTKDYIKFCSLGRTDLEEWAKAGVGGEVTLCPTCLGR